MKNTQSPDPWPFVLPTSNTRAWEVPPAKLGLPPGNLDSPSPWLDFWRMICVLAEELDAKEANPKETDAKEANPKDLDAEGKMTDDDQ